MSKQSTYVKSLATACSIAVIAIAFGYASAAMAGPVSTASSIKFLPNSEVTDPTNVTIEGDVACTDDLPPHGPNAHVCSTSVPPDSVGTITIQEARLIDGLTPTDCTGLVTWGDLKSDPPANGGTISVIFGTAGLGPTLRGFRVNYVGIGGDTVDSDTTCENLTILEPASVGVVKTLESGPDPTDVTGTAIHLEAPDLFDFSPAPDPDPTGPDDGVIGVALVDGGGYVVQQFFQFNIEITGLPDGTVVTDTIPGEFDLAGDAEDFAAGGDPENCDLTDGTCDGFTSDDTSCVVETSRAPGASEGTLPKLESEFLTITVNGLGSNTCTVMVWVKTDGNPGHLVSVGEGGPEVDEDNVWSLYEPTGCRLVGESPTNPALPMVDSHA